MKEGGHSVCAPNMVLNPTESSEGLRVPLSSGAEENPAYPHLLHTPIPPLLSWRQPHPALPDASVLNLPQRLLQMSLRSSSWDLCW